MKKENNITTAANSKTMNAIKNIQLYAAAVETEAAITFTAPNNDMAQLNSMKEKTTRKNRKNGEE